MTSLTQSGKGLQGVSRRTVDEISLYEGGILTDTCIAVNLKKLKEAFPRMAPSFFNLLAERIVANGFTDRRLTDAVNKIIDGFQYKELNVSDIVGFDRKAKMYTYPEVTALVTSGRYTFDDFETVEIDNKVYRVLKSELI